MSRCAAVLAAAVALLVLPASAPAVIKEAEYRVVLEANLEWKLAGKVEAEHGPDYSTFQVEATGRIEATIDDVLFRNGKLITDGHSGGSVFRLTGGGDTNFHRWVTIPNPPHWETEHGFCDVVEDRVSAGDASIANVSDTLRVRFGNRVFGAVSCPVGPSFWVDMANSPGVDEYTFDTFFDLPEEAIGAGLIIQNVAAKPLQRSPGFCPGSEMTGSPADSCEFDWSGTVRFEKTGGWEYGEDAPPLEEQLEQLADEQEEEAIYDVLFPPQVAPDPPADTPVIPAVAGVVPGAATLRSGTVAFTARCPAGCRGVAAIIGARRGKARAAGTLARLRFTVPAGDPRTITLRLPARARRALKRARGARVAVTLTPPDGRPLKATLPLRRR
jgi:hypothetical protein